MLCWLAGPARTGGRQFLCVSRLLDIVARFEPMTSQRDGYLLLRVAEIGRSLLGPALVAEEGWTNHETR